MDFEESHSQESQISMPETSKWTPQSETISIPTMTPMAPSNDSYNIEIAVTSHSDNPVSTSSWTQSSFELPIDAPSALKETNDQSLKITSNLLVDVIQSPLSADPTHPLTSSYNGHKNAEKPNDNQNGMNYYYYYYLSAFRSKIMQTIILSYIRLFIKQRMRILNLS